MGNSWRFTRADWHAIMEDFSQKIYNTTSYDRIEYSVWKKLTADKFDHIDLDYHQNANEFYISCYDKDDNHIDGHIFGIGKTTQLGKQTFGDYLLTDVIQKSLGWRTTIQPNTIQAFWDYADKGWFFSTSALIGFDIYQPIEIEIGVDTTNRKGDERCIRLRQDFPGHYKVSRVWEGDGSFGDYLFKTVVDPQNPYVKKEKSVLATNYDTATAYTTAAPSNYNFYYSADTTWNYPSGIMGNSGILPTNYATNTYGEIANKTEMKENEKMENKIFNFDFGPIKGDSVRMSMYGLAVKNKDGSYVAWDRVNENIMNVDILNFNGDGLMYKMPVAIKDIKNGDIVIHNRVPMFVLEVFDKSMDVIDIYSGERKSIIPTKSPFNFDFCTKIISILDTDLVATSSPSEDNPFGNLWMLMLLSGSMDNDSNLLPLMLMTSRDSIDPIMLMCLMNNKNTDNNILPLLMMSKKFGQS